ncbi:hypothetical protein F964_02086 [Acinetobacter guillouiae NIPH 991]|jgi:type 1 fimbria pilin|uniref:Uncharacterized protein n=3 Tax=cellular organisms TaxID=131567 RepID=N8WYZ2_ACIGI|nr:hypothetical protein F964_02086 [Acinetobacter guillouiae NIPH 991]
MSMNGKVLNRILLLIAGTVSSGTYAACIPDRGFSTVDVSMAVGRVVVRPSDPVGKVLRKASFPIRPNGSTYSCGSYGTLGAVLTQNYSLSPIGNSVYNTNIDGIGIRLYREAPTAPGFADYYPYTRSASGRRVLAEGFFIVEIVKTATSTGSGALVPGTYSSYRSGERQSPPWLTSTVYGNAITIASSSCEILGNINKTVTLPTVNKVDFKGVGSTQGEQAFDLNILCNGGKNPSGYEESNKISLSFDYDAVSSSTQNVLANTNTAGSSASGVGVQLLSQYKNSNKVIAKNDKLELGTLKSNDNIQYNVPMTARYYQTATKVMPGKVRAMATVTIEYD